MVTDVELAIKIYFVGLLFASAIWFFVALGMIADESLQPKHALRGWAINTLIWPWSLARVAVGVIRAYSQGGD